MKIQWFTIGTTVACVMLGTAFAQAQTRIVNFVNLNGGNTFGAPDSTRTTGNIWSFSDTTPLVSANENSGIGESNKTFYGGFRDQYPAAETLSHNYRLFGPIDGIEFQTRKTTGVNGRRRHRGMLIWNKADFLAFQDPNVTVGFDAASSMSLNIIREDIGETRFVVNDGGTYYVSDSSTGAEGTFSLTDFSGETWATVSTDDKYVIGSFAPHAFTDVQGVGFYFDNRSGNNQTIYQVNGFEVDAVDIPEVSAFGLLAACFALTSVMLRRRR